MRRREQAPVDVMGMTDVMCQHFDYGHRFRRSELKVMDLFYFTLETSHVLNLHTR